MEEPGHDVGADHGEEWYEVEPDRHEEEPEDLIDKVQELVGARSFRPFDKDVGWQIDRILVNLFI